jgi:hypothetical protein
MRAPVSAARFTSSKFGDLTAILVERPPTIQQSAGYKRIEDENGYSVIVKKDQGDGDLPSPASVFPGAHVPLLRVPGLFTLIRARGISDIDCSQGIVHKFSPNLSIGKCGPLRVFCHDVFLWNLLDAGKYSSR